MFRYFQKNITEHTNSPEENDLQQKIQFIKESCWHISCRKKNLSRLIHPDGKVISHALRFLDKGIIGGWNSAKSYQDKRQERCWALTKDGLALQDISGVITTLLHPTLYDKHGILEFRGKPRFNRNAEYILRRVEFPLIRSRAASSNSLPSDLICTIKDNSQKRKNLVIVRANKNSLHNQWPHYINEEERNWDLCISWFGEGSDVERENGIYEYFILQDENYKYEAIYSLLKRNPILGKYENYYFPEYDLHTSWRDINKLFNIFTRTGLDIAQPSLSTGSLSYINHPITAHDPKYHLRYTTFVEIMCPVFSHKALFACLPSFKNKTLGHGLDYAWADLLGFVPGRMAIIDDVVVIHANPTAASYSKKGARYDTKEMKKLYGFQKDKRVIGGILRENVTL